MEEELTRSAGTGQRVRGRARPSARLRQGSLAAAGITIALGLVACGDEDKTQFSERKTLTFIEQPSDDFGFADNLPRTQLGPDGPRQLSNGDKLTFSSEFLDRTGKDVGELDVSCDITRPGGFDKSAQQCAGTARLPGGALTLARGGRVFAGDSESGAVLGGTGAYAGATGDFTEAEEKGGKTKYTFDIVVPQQ